MYYAVSCPKCESSSSDFSEQTVYVRGEGGEESSCIFVICSECTKTILVKDTCQTLALLNKQFAENIAILNNRIARLEEVLQ